MIEFVFGSAVGALLAAAAGWWLWGRTAARIRTAVGADEPSRSVEEVVANAVARLSQEGRVALGAATSELRLREQALSSLDDGVVVLGAGREVVYANAAAERILGKALYDGELRHTALNSIASRAIAEAAVASSFDDPILHRHFEVSARRTDTGDFIIVVVRDETERRRLAAVRRDFVADASHELKTPVAAIQAAGETVMLALADGDVAGAQRFGEQVRRSARRLSHLVTDLLDLSRLESSDATSEPVEIGEVVRREVARHKDSVPRPNLIAAEEPMLVQGSEADLGLAIGNLLSNAVRYTEPEGEISVRVLADPGWVTIEVADTGLGIPTKDLPRIFERFYRVDPARSRATGGTGLGLSIVRHVAERHRGTVTAVSVLGEGSTFRMRIPRAS